MLSINRVGGQQVYAIATDYTPPEDAAPEAAEATSAFHGAVVSLAEGLVELRSAMLDARDTRLSGNTTRVSSSEALLVRQDTTTEVLEPGSATRLTSGSPVVSADRGFEDSRPAWAGGSTASPRLMGRYQGASARTLTFSVEPREDNPERKSLVITDEGGAVLERHNLSFGNQTLRLADGLSLQLGAGALELGDSFAVDLRPPTGEVDLDATFSGRPGEKLELASGRKIKKGTFEINGVSVAVGKKDSLRSVLERINAAGAGVVASFDAETGALQLERDEVGPGAIALGRDTSGFFQAMNLDDAQLTEGEDEVSGEGLSSALAERYTLSASSFTVNKTAIAVAEGDTLQAVVDRINSADSGAVAELSDDGRLSLRSEDPGRRLRLSERGEGFLDTVGIREGTYQAVEGTLPGRKQRTNITDSFKELSEASGDLYAAAGGDASLQALRDQLSAAIGESLEGLAPEISESISAIFSEIGDEDTPGLSRRELKALQSALKQSPDAILEAMLGSDEDGMGGIVGDALYALMDISEAMTGGGEQSGMVLQVTA
jgi:hypothetical protein